MEGAEEGKVGWMPRREWSVGVYKRVTEEGQQMEGGVRVLVGEKRSLEQVQQQQQKKRAEVSSTTSAPPPSPPHRRQVQSQYH